MVIITGYRMRGFDREQVFLRVLARDAANVMARLDSEGFRQVRQRPC